MQLIMRIFLGWVVGMVAFAGISVSSARMARADDQPAAKTKPGEGEKLDVESIKKKYWAKGEDAQLDVVQNRAYSLDSRLEFDLTGGTLSNDPFVSMKTLDLSIGYHFSEYISVHAMAWKIWSKPSSAADDFLKYAGFQASTNPESSFYGGEARYNLIYGKLSLLGSAIIYYDLHFAAGAGELKTSTGNYFAPLGGIGQQIYLNQWSALWVAFRELYHSETVPGLPQKRGVWTDAITLGFNFFLPKF